MDVHILGWIGLAIVVIALITTDIVGHVRKPHAPSMKEATAWTLGYVALAAAFGVAIWAIYGPSFAIQFYSGYIMEWSLSLDNLFVFVIIMSSFRVPREFQQKALLAGIILALIFRAFFIVVGVTLVNRFTWMFFFFGAWLLWTAYSQAREGASEEQEEEEQVEENGFVRFVRRIFPVTDGYIGDRFFYRHSGRTSVTPLFLVVLALGSADLMFALDSWTYDGVLFSLRLQCLRSSWPSSALLPHWRSFGEACLPELWPCCDFGIHWHQACSSCHARELCALH